MNYISILLEKNLPKLFWLFIGDPGQTKRINSKKIPHFGEFNLQSVIIHFI